MSMSGSKAYKEANARLKFVYFPVVEVQEQCITNFTFLTTWNFFKVYFTGQREYRDDFGETRN
jgi:hypothetical protein